MNSQMAGKNLTDNSTRWIAPEGVNFEVKSTQTLYSTPDFKSTAVSSITPQTVRVVDAQDNGWLKIKTSMGDKWIAPKGFPRKHIKYFYRTTCIFCD
ncbi:TPA: SH3 domain-containing protein [Bacillus toyonensis]|nr:SH3 domain-containing protein [Bacillus toyonensis]